MTALSFSNRAGFVLVPAMIEVIAENKEHLSEIDGRIGDGDHGANMDKGFQICKTQLDSDIMDLSSALLLLSGVLMEQIGGSMGPLYGLVFRAMGRACRGVEQIGDRTFLKMLADAEVKVREIGECSEGDKTLLDVLAPATRAFEASLASGADFRESLRAMKCAAFLGRDATVDMLARKGRSSRLGERSRGVPDAGASSCCLLLAAMADAATPLLQTQPDDLIPPRPQITGGESLSLS